MPAPWAAVWPEWKNEKRIGIGSFGTVYQAVRTTDAGEERTAVKVISVPQREAEVEALKAEGLGPEGIRRYFEEKARELLSEVRYAQEMGTHPRIVRVEAYAMQQDEEDPGFTIFIRMELLMPLGDYLADKSLTPRDVVTLGRDICEALAVCHRKQLLHRDVKPENIFVDGEGRFKLGDFGIARRLDNPATYLTQVGTPYYMAPEVFSLHSYDGRADIYSLGLVLYRFLNRSRLPFMNEGRLSSPADRRRAMEWRLKGEALPLPQDAPEGLARAVLKACAFKPEDRYATAEDFGRALEKSLQESSAGTEKKRRKRRVLAAGLLLLCIGLFFLMKGLGRTEVPEESITEALAEAKTTTKAPAETETETETETEKETETETETDTETETETEALTEAPTFTDEKRFVFLPAGEGQGYAINHISPKVFYGDLRIPEQYQGLPVTGINDTVMKGLQVQGDLVLPGSFTSLGAMDLADCQVAGRVMVPGTVEWVEWRCFGGSKLGSLELQEGVKLLKSGSLLETRIDYLLLPASLLSAGKALDETSQIGILEIRSEAVLDEWTNGQAGAFCTPEEIRLGTNIRHYYVQDGCLIYRPGKTLIRTARDFNIPADGSVERIGFYAIDWTGKDKESLVIPDTIQFIEEDAIRR